MIKPHDWLTSPDQERAYLYLGEHVLKVQRREYRDDEWIVSGPLVLCSIVEIDIESAKAEAVRLVREAVKELSAVIGEAA
jgi:hypothetical protein